MADPNNNRRRPNLLTGGCSAGKQYLASKTAPSIFSVEVAVRHEKQNNLKAMRKYVALTDKATDVMDTGVPTDELTIKRRQQTGFVVHSSDTQLFILTTAHAVDCVFKKGVHQVTAEELNLVFLFGVACTHHEAQIQADYPDGNVSELLRSYCDAHVVALDIEKDLLLLAVTKDELCLQDVDVGGVFVPCSSDHPIIHLADLPPEQSDLSLLQGWPPLRANSSIWGSVSYLERPYDVLTSCNTKGYTMKLTEFHEFDCANGFSGGPVINGDGQCMAVFHAVMVDAKCGYAICLEDVREFLTNALENLLEDNEDGDGGHA
ncbi:uncharacterized protein [Oryza sativa Japonica Group]|uniref:Os08g0148566 protein n=2 Tax=Oryza sativa subsp. japonica TaxID=39947 RepID=C7J5T2_ORYSJ|nr:uncharacterized protein LOC9270763 isoform X2 [Oryza sativa Japonica Group]KAF2918078.1 hypothetical protein DAI22_08g030600 [Oryza sativa Japonica Group]BAH94109.1 Os08g0148500 [Oryza sativa Japonica Group]BAT03826.1 Os08g0148566 [Oryza sativa Japonica Group]|eukprot:NP_001175381.1 Os08g0148500 [Oryza sativa Japonica Group]